jgi:uncharacterized protein
MGNAGLNDKETRLCNLRCSYCHDWATGPNQTMTFPVMARMIASALRDPEHDAVDFIWHGGETTALPTRFYEKAMAVQARFRRPGQGIRNLIQTNGTRLTPAWARFFKANRFEVGVSVDGPPEVHDRYRRYANGRASFDDVMRGIRLLQEYQVSFGVLMVVDAGVLALGPDRVFDFFAEHGIRNYGFCAAKPTNQPDAPPDTPTEHYTNPVAMNAFLKRVYDRWLAHGDRRIQIRELTSIDVRLMGGPNVSCTLGGGCLGHYYLIEPNGEVAHCDLFLGDARYTLGNVLTDDFAAIRQSANLRQLQGENERALAAMRGCPEFGVCQGWCPHERYISRRHNPHHRADCCGLRELIEHVRARSPERTPRAREVIALRAV